MSSLNDIRILFEDEDILVADKPCGLVVNVSETTPDNTFQDFLASKIDFTGVDETGEFFLRKGVVHRLDKDTSGILVAAKNEPSFNNLKQQFKTRRVEKEYLALVLGIPSESKIEVNAPIKRDPKNRLRMCVHPDGREAVTDFEIINSQEGEYGVVALLKASPLTGRTHQIRVHLSALNLPIVGDEIYMTRKQLELSYKYFTRLMLHASKLSFQHPKTLQEMTHTSEVPPEFVPFMPENIK